MLPGGTAYGGRSGADMFLSVSGEQQKRLGGGHTGGGVPRTRVAILTRDGQRAQPKLKSQAVPEPPSQLGSTTIVAWVEVPE